MRFFGKEDRLSDDFNVVGSSFQMIGAATEKERYTKFKSISGNRKLQRIDDQKLSYFGHVKRHQTLEKLILEGKVKGQRNRAMQKISCEKDVEDWMRASVLRVGRTAEDRLIYGRSTKAATSGNG